MYIYHMKPTHHSHYNEKVEIIHHEICHDYEGNTAYLMITEILDGIPQRTLYYKIPESYKDDRLLGELHERYCKYCPN
jgi:hypothetical protein